MRPMSWRVGRVALAGAAAVLLGLLLLFQMSGPVAPTATPVDLPTSSSHVRLPPSSVQSMADRVTVSFDGIVRVDRKVVLRLSEVSRSLEPAISGATDATWAIAVVGDIRQTWGLLDAGNSRCAIWFVNTLGQIFATQRGAISRCDPYMNTR